MLTLSKDSYNRYLVFIIKHKLKKMQFSFHLLN